MNDKNPEFFVHLIYKNSLYEFFKNFISKDKLKVKILKTAFNLFYRSEHCTL